MHPENCGLIIKVLLSGCSKKQTIYLGYQKIDEKTIQSLKRGDRYKLFKFNLTIKTKGFDNTEWIYRMLDEMPDLEVSKISGHISNNDAINALMEKPIFKTKQDLFKIIEFSPSYENDQSEPLEYLSYVACYTQHEMV